MFIQLDDIAVHACVDGPPQGPAVLLLHSLGTALGIWEPQAAALARRGFRVLRMDMRGHGLTEATPGPYTMDGLAADAFRLLDALGVPAAHVGGISIGGRIALHMAAQAPARVLSLLPCDTALEFPPRETWQQRMEAVGAGGIAQVAEATLGRWVLDPSLASSRGLRRMLLATDPAGWLGCAAALRDCTAAELAGRIACPTTVIVGEQDQSTPPAAAAAIQAAIPGARLVTIAEAAHIPSLEREPAFTRAVLGHMEAAAAVAGSAREAGLAVRRAVLGAAHVERSEAALTPFDQPFRDFILDGVWGSVWTRPGLPHRDRSLLCLAMLAALGHHEELRLHVRATAQTGVTPAEIAEVLLQVAAYAGVPAANGAMRIARETLAEMGA
jgi:3-oxoadipate enol-lactonase/4-carboxymuconolactone decarboxylase